MIKLPVFLDTAPIVYLVENHPKFGPLCEELLNLATSQTTPIYTSVLTVSETLIKPIKTNNLRLLQAYQVFFRQTPKLEVNSPLYSTALLVAEIRSSYNFSLADSFQLALAQENRCQTFLTNDRQLIQFKNLKVICLSDLIAS